MRGSREELTGKVSALVEANRSLQREIEALKGKLAATQSVDLATQAVDIDGVKVLGAQVSGDSKGVMKTLDGLRDRLGRCVVVLGHVDNGKVSLACGVAKDLTDRLSAGDVINFVGAQVGAKGGGRPDMARAGGGDNPDALPQALDSLAQWVSERLAP